MIPDALLKELLIPLNADPTIPVGQMGSQIECALAEAYKLGHSNALEVMNTLQKVYRDLTQGGSDD